MITSEIEGLACHHEVEGIIVEGGDIDWFPDFIIEALFEFLLNCVFVEPGEMPLKFLCFILGEQIERNFLLCLYNEHIDAGFLRAFYILNAYHRH